MDLEFSKELTRLPDGSGEAKASLIGMPDFGLRLPISKSAFVFEKSAQVPHAKDVDSIASFVEAAEELEREPFFGPDEKRTCTSGGKFQTFHLGDRFHFRSALISFRRIWMEGETSNFHKVCGILWRYAVTVEERVAIQWARSFIQQTENGKGHHPLKVEITGRDLISLWINTVFAHGGGDEKRKHKRADFDRYVADCGQGPLEYAFRNAVWAHGLQYISFARDNAKPMLERWERQHELQPSFNIGSAFGSSTRERTKEGHIIVRRASSEYAADETFDQSLKRILERHKFQNLQFILKQLELGDRNPVRLILKSDGFSELAQSLGYEIRIVDKVSDKMNDYGDSFRAFSGLHNGRKQSILHMFDLYMVTDRIGLEILAELLSDLKNTLINE